MNTSNNKMQSSSSSSSSLNSNCGAAFKTQQQVQAVVTPPAGLSSAAGRASAPCSAPVRTASDSLEQQTAAASMLCPPNVAMLHNSSSSTSSCSSSLTFMVTVPFHLVLIGMLLLYCSVSMTSGRVMGGQQNHHHHHHHSNPHALMSLAAGQPVFASEQMVSMINGDLLLSPSSLLQTVSEKAQDVCGKSSDREATILRSMSKTTGQPVLLLPQQLFKVAYCAQSASGSASAETEQCAVGSNCATVYRWKKALVKPPKNVEQQLMGLEAADFEFADDILVPIDCLCVLGWAQIFRGKGPIIFG